MANESDDKKKQGKLKKSELVFTAHSLYQIHHQSMYSLSADANKFRWNKQLKKKKRIRLKNESLSNSPKANNNKNYNEPHYTEVNDPYKHHIRMDEIAYNNNGNSMSLSYGNKQNGQR